MSPLIKIDDLVEHPQSSIVPEMRTDEWEAFVDDVRDRGITDPIVICGKIILDGRHRVRACRELHVDKVPFRAVSMNEGAQLNYLIRAALLRRHLSDSQRAMLAARLKPAFEVAANERQKQAGGEHKNHQKSRENGAKALMENFPQALASGTARDQAGKAAGVSGKLVDAASKVIDEGTPKLVEMVDAGEVSVSAAAAVAKLPRKKQAAVVKEGPKSVKKAAKDVREGKISGGATFDVGEIEKVTKAEEAAKPKTAEDCRKRCDAEFGKALNQLKQFRRTLNVMFDDGEIGPWLEEKRQSLIIANESCTTTLATLRPAIECPKCKGKKCDFCRKTGWMTSGYANQRK